MKLATLLQQLFNERFLLGLNHEQFLSRASVYFAELNYIHPFREGNGRAVREFMRQLFEYDGYEVDWTAVTVEHLMDAMIDSVYEPECLEAVLCECLSQKQ